jgi:hypothetical protein
LSSRCSIGSPEHLVPGAAPVSSRCLQAPAADHGPVLNQAIEYRSNAQSAIISAFQLSAIFAKPSTATATPTPNPHSRQALTAFPRVRSSEAFRRRPPNRVDRSRRAGIRNPSRFQTFPPSLRNRRRVSEASTRSRRRPAEYDPENHLIVAHEVTNALAGCICSVCLKHPLRQVQTDRRCRCLCRWSPLNAELCSVMAHNLAVSRHASRSMAEIKQDR